MQRLKIEAISYYLPENILTNEQLKKENPSWDMRLLEETTGVACRHIAHQNETALDLAYHACRKMFLKHPEYQQKIDAIIFCTETGDYPLPPNACILHKLLDLPEHVLAFDFNLSCSGYVYGLIIAQGLMATGQAKNILLVNADTYSKYINNNDRSTRILFGDGAAVSLLVPSDSEKGIIDIIGATAGKEYDKLIVRAGGCKQPKSGITTIPETDRSGNVRTLENIYMDGLGILVFVNSKVPLQINAILKRNQLKTDDVDLFVFHQSSKMSLDSLTRLLKVNQEKVYRNMNKIGNTVSASIPIALEDAITEDKARPGDKIVLCGFGVGLSWATAIVQL